MRVCLPRSLYIRLLRRCQTVSLLFAPTSAPLRDLLQSRYLSIFFLEYLLDGMEWNDILKKRWNTKCLGDWQEPVVCSDSVQGGFTQLEVTKKEINSRTLRGAEP